LPLIFACENNSLKFIEIFRSKEKEFFSIKILGGGTPIKNFFKGYFNFRNKFFFEKLIKLI